jgi:nucleobase:cation symporter-1, NCS1 family
MLASGLIAGGMSWWQAIGTILLGNLIVLVPMLLNAHAGAKYGIPFPVFVRASFGVRGANIPAVLRALVACGWFGIQTWIGGQAIFSMLRSCGRRAQAAGGVWICFFAFWAAEHGGDLARHRDHQVSGRHRRAVHAGHRPAAALVDHRQSRRPRPGAERAQQVPPPPSSCASSFRRSPAWWDSGPPWRSTFPISRATPNRRKAQAVGQALGLPTAMTLYSFIGVAVTSASVVLFGEAIWDPVALLGRFNQPVVASIALVALLVATLNTNVAANVVSPSNDFSNLNPRHFVPHRRHDHRRGRRPDDAVEAAGRFQRLHFRLAGGIFGLLGPIAGVMIADYFLVRRAR